MRIFYCLKSGINRSVRAWKGLVIIWVVSLVVVSFIALPVRGILNTGLGNSMISERLAKGIDIEVFADLGAYFKSISSSLLNGTLILLLACFVLNTFLTGGLFDSLKRNAEHFSYERYFKASVRNFPSFLFTGLIISVIISLAAIFVILIPVSVIAGAESVPEGTIFKVLIILSSVFVLVTAYLLVVADFARAWQASVENKSFSRALSVGFRQATATFGRSYPLMLLILLLQFCWCLLAFIILSDSNPATGSGVFLLFILSQLLYFLKIFLKSARYGSLTTVLESTAVFQQPEEQVAPEKGLIIER
jgi:hypothetical protein